MAAPAETTTLGLPLGRTAWELAAKANEAHALSSLNDGELESWLLSRGLAEPRDGGLIATDAGRELGAVLE